MVGASFPYAVFLPPEGQARAVRTDIDEPMLSLRYPMEAKLAGEARAMLAALIPHLERKEDRAWRVGRALCDRGQARASGPSRDRAGR